MNGEHGITLVTGGSGGIGSAIVRRQAADGQRVVNLDRVTPPDDLPAVTHLVDLADAAATRALLARILAHEPVARLVNNAAVLSGDSLESMSMDAFDEAIAVNVIGALTCVQAVVPSMKATGFGRIVNVSSRAALGRERRSAYSATKGAINTVTRTWALELAPYGITVNAVAPGAVRTAMHQRGSPADDPMSATIHRSIALGRVAEPEEIAHAVAFFLDRRTTYVTGQLLYACGGLSIGGIVGAAQV